MRYKKQGKNTYFNKITKNTKTKNPCITRVFFVLLCFIFGDYFPIQKLAKIFPNKSSLVISPVISPK